MSADVKCESNIVCKSMGIGKKLLLLDGVHIYSGEQKHLIGIGWPA